ncbi:unnamed protein product [Cylicocyclus nassatus]|uniref:Neurotransmitter-gated ion-channel ligand-binding domain-containing protein n=1 Tax=Cylicocyclus nassatus TaxID=53992 RepID=A0AA36H5W5_CYLNA|nr:unnamed protein product [Cylicocyclus nassatus]
MACMNQYTEFNLQQDCSRGLFLQNLIPIITGFVHYTIETEIKIDGISNIDFVKQTFHIQVEVEQYLMDLKTRHWQKSEALEKPDNVFRDIKFDVVHSEVLEYVEFAKDYANVTGVRRREMLTVLCGISHYFPLDTHTCLLKMISRKIPSDELLLKWRNPPHTSVPTLNVPFLVLSKVTPITCMHNLGLTSSNSARSTFVSHACIGIRLELKRPLSTALYRFYIPTSLMLFMAWLCFYIDRANYGIRLMLILASIALQITFCSLFIYLSGIYVATITPADVWCALLAVHSSAVVMFIFVSVVMESRVRKYRALSMGSKDIRDESRLRHERRAMRSAMYKKEEDLERSACGYATITQSYFRRCGDNASLYSARLDITARVVCPVLFILLTSIYFLLYMLSSYQQN